MTSPLTLATLIFRTIGEGGRNESCLDYRFPRGQGDGSGQRDTTEWTVGARELLRVQLAGILHVHGAPRGLIQTAYLVATGMAGDTVELKLAGTAEALVVLAQGVRLVSRRTAPWEAVEW
jgi:hypothetical protein